MKHDVAGKPGLDPALPNVGLRINGKPYQLAFDFNAICQVRTLTGINLMGQSTDLFSDPINFRALLWASLLADQPDLTLEQAGALVNRRNYLQIVEAVAKAWELSAPDPEEEKATGE